MKKLELCIACILAIGILPAFTELSHFLGPLKVLTGPLSVLKLGTPLLIAYVYLKRSVWFSRSSKTILGILALFAFTSFIASGRCDFQKPFLRESFLMFVGSFWGLAFVLLPQERRIKVALTWVILVLGSALIDSLLPDVNLWLLANVFDSTTRKADFDELRTYVLTGVFGRQSLAKLMVWTPWIYLITLGNDPSKVRERAFGFLMVAISTGSVLATTQRGALLAALGAAGVFLGVVLLTQKTSKRLIFTGAAGILLTSAVFLVAVPKNIVESRVLGTIAATSSQTPTPIQPGAEMDRLTRSANVNIGFRTAMLDLSIHSILREPLGNACIAREEFTSRRLTVGAHSHNLFIEQFRSRGWAWGLVHLTLWVLALYLSWSRFSGMVRATLIAGICAFGITGLFDQIWTVMNHSMLIGAILWKSLQPRWELEKSC